MAKAAPSEPVTGAASGITMSLTEFCTRLSETVKRPELIGAFEFRERTAKRNKATEAEFRQRFDAFVNTPV